MFGGYSVARLAVLGVANLGVAKVVSDVITTTAIPGTIFAAAKSKIGILVIGSLVGEVVTKHVDGRIDQVVAMWAEQKAEIDAKVEEKLQEAIAKKTEEPK